MYVNSNLIISETHKLNCCGRNNEYNSLTFSGL